MLTAVAMDVTPSDIEPGSDLLPGSKKTSREKGLYFPSRLRQHGRP